MTSRQLAPLILALALLGPACGGGGEDGGTGPSGNVPVAVRIGNISVIAQNHVPFHSETQIQVVNGRGERVYKEGVGISASLTGGPGGTLAGQLEIATDVNGVAHFPDLTLEGPVGVYHLLFTSSGLTSDSSTVFLEPGLPAFLALLTPDSQSVEVAQASPLAPSVKVLDQDLNPVSDIRLGFSVIEGGGLVSPSQVTTNNLGVATVGSWAMGSVAGRNRLAVRAFDWPELADTFVATSRAAAPSVIRVVAGGGQAAPIQSTLPVKPAVRVSDRYDNPIQGAVVEFNPTSTRSHIADSVQTTDAQGQAVAGDWSLGTVSGEAAVLVRLRDFPATEQAIAAQALAGPPSVIAVASQYYPDSILLPVGHAFGFQSFVVTDAFGNRVSGATVSFTPSSGGTVHSPSSLSDFDGVAQLLYWKLGPTPGLQTLTVSSGAATRIRFARTHAGTQLLKVAGDSLPVGAGQHVTTRPKVRLLDADGAGVPGVPVTFHFQCCSTDEGTLLGGDTVLTGADGTAESPDWQVGTNVVHGSTLVAENFGLAALVFRALVQPGPPVLLHSTLLGVRSDAVGNAVSDALDVKVEDQYANGVPGITLSWSVTQSGATLGPVAATTDVGGIGRATVTLPTTPGPVQVRTTSPVLPSDTVLTNLIAAPGPIDHFEMLGGNNQSAPVRKRLANPLRVRLLDRFNNPIPGIDAVFNVPVGAGSVSNAFPVADSEGVATAEWTLGPVPGPQTLEVRRSSVTISFTATATPPVLATLTGVGGSGFSSAAAGPYPIPVAVRVRDVDGFPAVATQVSFAVSAGGGSLAASSVSTDSAGIARLSGWTLGLGANALSATVAALPGQSATFTATGQPAGSGYSITLNLGGNPSPAVQQAFANASARWSQVIVGDIPDQPVSVPANSCFPGQGALNLTVDDILIYAFITPIDGPGGILGGTGGCVFRANGIPLIAIIQLDADDLGAFAQYVPDIVLHELGHAIGVGSAWQQQGLVTGAGGATPRFTGSAARLGYWAVRGTPGVFPDGVPLETIGGQGTRDVHWAETTFGAELMTGFVNLPPNPMSLVTTGSLQDLGYQVNNAAADQGYTTASLRAQAARGVQLPLREAPWNGPTFTISPDGALVPR